MNSKPATGPAMFGKKPTPQKSDDLVLISFWEGKNYPMVVKPAMPDILLNEWVRSNNQLVRENLLRYGAILFRGFDIKDVTAFQLFVDSFSDKSLRYFDKTSPRSVIKDRLYTSTDHPADQVIDMHNELSYSANWPMSILFYCDIPSETGGETPIADSRKVLSSLPQDVVSEFRKKGIKYVRNMVNGIGLSWNEVYQTTEKSVVEEHCRKNNISFEWIDDNHLRISWYKPAIEKHPITGEEIWFNHSFFYGTNNLDPLVLEVFKAENLPFAAYYGDGSPISLQSLMHIREAYEKTKVQFSWEKGDILLLDNMLMAHGRNSFTGKRKIAVGMCDPHHKD